MNATEMKKLHDRLDSSTNKQFDSMLKNFSEAMVMLDTANARSETLGAACIEVLDYLRTSGACVDPAPGIAANKLRLKIYDALGGKAKGKKGDGDGDG